MQSIPPEVNQNSRDAADRNTEKQTNKQINKLISKNEHFIINQIDYDIFHTHLTLLK